MLKHLRSNHGYALLTVLLMVMIISITGLTLMGWVINSSKLVQINKTTIENKATADMAVDEAMAQIEKAVDSINTNISNLTIDVVQAQLKSSLDGIRKLGTYPYTITHTTINDGTNGNAYVEKVTINAPIGNTGHYETKTISVSTIPGVFKYATVTPGSLQLNGSSYIEGDVSVGGDLLTSNYGRFMQSINGNAIYYPVLTSYPAIKGSLSVLGSFKNYSNGIWNTFTPTTSNVNTYFSVPPSIKTSNINVDTFNITNLVSSKSGNLKNANANYNTYYYNSTTNLNGSTFSNLYIDSSGNVTINGNLVITGNLIMNSGAKLTVNGSIRVSGSAQLSGTLTINDSYNQGNYIYIAGSTSINSFNMNGQMYVNNTVSIQNDLNTNGTIYSSGDASVQNLSNNAGTLVLLSDGNIQLSNNNLYNDTPKTINAFFYSNKTLEIYGVGSNLKIVGGIYGNQIILNAVKGKSSQSYFSNSFSVPYLDYYMYGSPHYSYYYFQNNQNSIDPTLSRLSVIYKNGLILNPPKGIPTTQNLTIQELNTTYSN
ncbi:hypothetical protein HPT25_26810 [Bacillus sp. BRMEA1]|uniref:hypothetical protein n=1 Tax=Neobacillus endophyticus TaxID=2738405 RepID=UPI001563FF78|nr:hypothetical protein [Neobacillus endophyticus]NRD80939.1 hypothetical protein [Neobacillus endophyticus]